MKTNTSHLVKHTSPTKWDKASYSTIWRNNDPSKSTIFMQMSKDFDNPNWQPMADVMVKAFDRFYSDPYFVEECIKLYEENVNQEDSRTDYVEFVKKELSE